MSEDDKEDDLDRKLDELYEEMKEEDEEYDKVERIKEILDEVGEEDAPQDTEESEANPETIEQFLKAEEDEEIRAKKLKVLDNLLKEQEDTEFFQFLHEHPELENVTKMFCFALIQLADETANNFTATGKREADLVRVEYEFFDSDGNRVYFEKDGTVTKIFSGKSEKP